MADPLFLRSTSGTPAYDQLELRRGHALLLPMGQSDRLGAREGVRPGRTFASLSGTDWVVHDLTAVVYPGVSSTDGPYLVHHLEESDALDPADGSNDRIDALDLQVQDDDADASGQRRSRVVYVTGTPGSSPSAPALTTNSLRLATINVPAGDTAGSTLTEVAPWTVASGGIVPVRDDTERPTAGFYPGFAVWRQDNGELEVRHGGAWHTVAAVGHGQILAVDQSDNVTNQSSPSSVQNLIALNFSDPGGQVTVHASGWVKAQQIANGGGAPGTQDLVASVYIDAQTNSERGGEEFTNQNEVHTFPVGSGRTFTPAGAFAVELKWTSDVAGDFQHLASHLQAQVVAV